MLTRPQQNLVMPPSKRSTSAGSREVSPPSALVSGQGSPPAFFPSPSPGATSLCSVEYVNGAMLGNSSTIPKWTNYIENFKHGLPTPQRSQQINQRKSTPLPFSVAYPLQTILTIHPTPLKSRVETQIPIKMTLFPVPIGITKLHLPTHTISKPKLLAKPPPGKSPDTLELYTSLVCTSAMQNSELRKRAFERAAASTRTSMSPKEEPKGSGIDEDDENKPANGGEVKICSGCIIRERKRAARKKAKKVEEEESWQKHETQRVIVFNTYEIKDWQVPTQRLPSDSTGDQSEPFVPEGAMQVDAPMRIACYCRHQNEKSGFQVIFTLKDYQDKLVAQAITASIMITDDHKTSTVPSINSQPASSHDFIMGQTHFSDKTYDMNIALPRNPGAFRMSHSSSDLQVNKQRSVSIEIQASSTGNSPRESQQIVTPLTSHTPHHNSPTICQGPFPKKRKASSSSKLPTALAMTSLESKENNNVNKEVLTPSPFTPCYPNFPVAVDQYSNTNNLQSNSTHFSGPPTPNSTGKIFSHINRSQSIDSQPIQTMYSTPVSGIPSRVSSPNGMRTDSYQRQQAQLAQAVANGLYAIPISLNPHRQPVIHKMIPNEGPKAGGIEVTCLGSGFVQGLEVMFGDTKATTTTFWGETSLVCLLPPSSFAGNYPVTFKHQHQQQHMQPYAVSMPKQQTYFKYVDDDELQILRTALSVLGHKMTGKIEDVRDLARRIVGGNSSSWASQSGSTTSPNQAHTSSVFNNTNTVDDLETVLLKILDLIDLDDSLNMPRYNLRRASGQSMLHLACSLGLHRFVAALLARGANPDPKDKGGFTPMHFAALHNHSHIVRRLMLSGANPFTKNLQGYTPIDLSKSMEVTLAFKNFRHRSKSRSAGSFNSRKNSPELRRSPWKQKSMFYDDLGTENDDSIKIDDMYYSDVDKDQYCDSWTRPESFLPNQLKTPLQSHGNPEHADNHAIHKQPGTVIETTERSPSSIDAILLLRDLISAQIQTLQQIMHTNIPQILQIPRFDILSQILAVQDYQFYLPNTNPMVKRITNLVQRPGFSKEQENKWWDLFSTSVPAPPPAYEDIFPQTVTPSKCDKNTYSTQAKPQSSETTEKCDVSDVSGGFCTDRNPPIILSTLRMGRRLEISPEEQKRIRLARAKRLKILSRDRNLFFIWVSPFS